MTRKEVIDFLAKRSHYYKKSMRTIPEMLEIGKELGYDIVKNSTDNYTIYEECAIKDFTKPLKIVNDCPDQVLEVYQGCPLGLILKNYETGCFFHYPYQAWCYLAHKKNGEKINLEEFQFLSKKDLNDSVYSFDLLKHLGYIEETEDSLIFYLYPQKQLYQMPCEMWNNSKERLAPLKY